ncbi:MAG: branched-chain amino acid ABC transporter permease [Proteobacteria bacterium]|nr:branched-chain amino acid ABC transporter permease [Pseudomonadota bacterium]MBU1451823.1 branched-chain amino acid ABC transporter permease [Pseudomonadota bacterium]MBU2470505.1 branched-chain amino acid ABC transporter permease [Pseudomonadota bacterium]
MFTQLLQLTANGLLLGAIYALNAMGLTLIFGVMEIINFAHGEFLMLAMYGAFFLNVWMGMGPYVAIVVVVPLFFVLGVAFQRLMIQPLLDSQEIAQIFATVGLSIVLSNGALFFFSADYQMVRTDYSLESLDLFGVYLGYTRIFAFAAVCMVALGLYLFMKRTYMGRAIRATAQDRRAAALMGVNVRRVYMITTGLGLACVGITGSVLSPIFSVFPSVGTQFGLIAFVVVVLGGMGNLAGAFFGGLIIGLVEAYSGFFLDPALKTVVYFVVFILILLVKPSGLFGSTVRENG